MLVKVEAVNIYGFVDDSQNLSAVRGAGLMLLEMPKAFGEWLRSLGQVTTLTEGASKAIFRLTAGEKSGDVEKLARGWLTERYPHATVAVSVLGTDNEGFFVSDEKLTTAIRAAQMRSFSIAGLPEVESGGVCAWDHVRPATKRVYAKRKHWMLSEPTADKHERGRRAKGSFLHQHAGVGGDWTYTSDMEDLSKCEARGILHHKVALFYADGNSLTKLLRKSIELQSQDKQEAVIKRFDEFLRGKRRAFLKALLLRTGEARWQTADGARRIELLLWGGDELMMLAPAWCGWEMAELFCETMKGAVFDEGKVPLKHAMGLIFAHHKAPIHALRRLVRELAEEAKEQDRKKDLMSYLVLESFDHIGEDLKRFRNSRGTGPVALNAEGAALASIAKTLKSLKDAEFPRRKVFQAALGLAQGKDWTKLKEDVEPFLKYWEKDLDEWKKLTGGATSAWAHLAELWDYVGVAR